MTVHPGEEPGAGAVDGDGAERGQHERDDPRGHGVAEALHRRDAADSTVVDFLTAADGVTVVDSTHLDFAQTVAAVLDVVAAGNTH